MCIYHLAEHYGLSGSYDGYVDSSQTPPSHQLAFLSTMQHLEVQTALESREENKNITMAFSLSSHKAAVDIAVYLVLEELNPWVKATHK